MRYVDEYREEADARKFAAAVKKLSADGRRMCETWHDGCCARLEPVSDADVGLTHNVGGIGQYTFVNLFRRD